MSSFGNNLLYLLTEKKSLPLQKFGTHIEFLYRQDSSLDGQEWTSFDTYSLARDLSALGYLDIGHDTRGRIVQAAPPLLVALPTIRHSFLLTGTRSLNLLEKIRTMQGVEIDNTTHKLLPDTVILKPESIEVLKGLLSSTSFQEENLSSYIKLLAKPIAWDILEFAGELKDYESSLERKWHSGDRQHISKIFNPSELKFCSFQQGAPIDDALSLIKVKGSYSSYLYRTIDSDRAEVDLDYGKFLVTRKPILKYKKNDLCLESLLRLPLLFERGLSLLSATPPQRKEEVWVFNSVSRDIAKLVFDKLNQAFVEI